MTFEIYIPFIIQVFNLRSTDLNAKIGKFTIKINKKKIINKT